MHKLITAVVIACFAVPAYAAGDAAKGEADFKKCKACHSIVKDDGTAVVKGGKTGPNLFGVIGRTAGTVADFKYGDGIVAAGAAGVIWDEALLATYLADPTTFLKDKTGDAAAKSKMTFKLAKGGEDIAAYLATMKP